ncbi:MAG: AraC family transcriptional regulator [Bacteroidia bacterium 44-10]|jgi:AraC family transcriptional activator of pobA|nr:MAG: AraC family transcriptional regulator [Bacteroidia bacterium 44-10]
MKNIPKYDFYKTKYGGELLIDVVELEYIKNYLPKQSLHTLTYYDVTLITEGEGFFKIDGTTHHVKPMDMLFSLPYQLREWDIENITNGYALIFEEEFLLSFFNDPHFMDNISYFRKNRNNSRLSLFPVEFEQVNTLIQQIKHEIDGYTVKNKHILRALLYQVLILLDRTFTEQHNIPPNNDKNTYVDSFLKLVSFDFHKYHAVQYYAEKLYITPNYLNELVKRETGISAKQVIQNKLIIESKKLLLYSNLTIVEISERLSFETPSYFIRFFRKRARCTPLQFRKGEKP